jgi:hypothetical protein
MSAMGSIGREALRGEGEEIGIRVGADRALVSQLKVSAASQKKKGKHSTPEIQRPEQNSHGGERQANRHILRFARYDAVVCASPPPNKASSENVDPSAGRGIGDFAEDGRSARAGGRGQICRALMKRFISEESEGEGFLRVYGHAEAGGSKDGHE